MYSGTARENLSCNTIPLLSVAKQPHHHIRLNKNLDQTYIGEDFCLKLEWETPNNSFLKPRDYIVISDASGSWHGKQNQFQLPWDEATVKLHIAVKELLPIVISSAMWGDQ